MTARFYCAGFEAETVKPAVYDRRRKSSDRSSIEDRCC